MPTNSASFRPAVSGATGLARAAWAEGGSALGAASRSLSRLCGAQEIPRKASTRTNRFDFPWSLSMDLSSPHHVMPSGMDIGENGLAPLVSEVEQHRLLIRGGSATGAVVGMTGADAVLQILDGASRLPCGKQQRHLLLGEGQPLANCDPPVRRPPVGPALL